MLIPITLITVFSLGFMVSVFMHSNQIRILEEENAMLDDELNLYKRDYKR